MSYFNKIKFLIISEQPQGQQIHQEPVKNIGDQQGNNENQWNLDKALTFINGDKKENEKKKKKKKKKRNNKGLVSVYQI